MTAIPRTYANIGTIMTNFDHTIEPDAEEKLKAGGCYGGYAAWNFHGAVWWDGTEFKCEVSQYRTITKTISGASLQEIMDTASEWYGQM